MSRRLRNRRDRRVSYFDGDSPDIEAAFKKLTEERRKQEPEETEPRLLILSDGSAIDKQEPWQVPVGRRG